MSSKKQKSAPRLAIQGLGYMETTIKGGTSALCRTRCFVEQERMTACTTGLQLNWTLIFPSTDSSVSDSPEQLCDPRLCSAATMSPGLLSCLFGAKKLLEEAGIQLRAEAAQGWLRARVKMRNNFKLLTTFIKNGVADTISC